MDVERIRRQYRRNAPFYDIFEQRRRRLRDEAIDRLGLLPGEVVVDLGCGTGASFDRVERGIGPRGRLVGVDVSSDMLARARARAEHHGWHNITLIEANAEEVDLAPESVDAVLSVYNNDIMNSKRAVERAARALRTSGRFVAAGAKRARGLCGLLVNPLTVAESLAFITTPLTAAPWRNMEGLLDPLDVVEREWGRAYIARGVKSARRGAKRARVKLEAGRGN